MSGGFLYFGVSRLVLSILGTKVGSPAGKALAPGPPLDVARPPPSVWPGHVY